MKKDNQKQLIDDLINFLRSGKRKSIVIADYIALTNPTKKWTEKQKKELYRALERTNALSIANTQCTKIMSVRENDSPKNRSIEVNYTRTEVMLLV
ncbi:hypothetical protein A5819_003476 [Enterococcus sp. 7E2_DIV0204]|uniref:hypothetical protein n=1 Tax=unclassified Enterococcus TaxID=2608891 RepID=UPI000A3381F6|nr:MULTISPECIES: hypothetical protein [unclassified Enterococcus]OTN83926.1 hypothetical protein A5819_003476 [Enterococcus sp. 7E2_DIV0204]OTP46834.1 hypothetical protein A5884_003712 [Enterococcus sp. 7D2_DIV0200]